MTCRHLARQRLLLCNKIFAIVFGIVPESLFPDMLNSVNIMLSVQLSGISPFNLLCEKLNISYDSVKNTMLKNNWINPMHTQVPGTDGKLSRWNIY